MNIKPSQTLEQIYDCIASKLNSNLFMTWNEFLPFFDKEDDTHKIWIMQQGYFIILCQFTYLKMFKIIDYLSTQKVLNQYIQNNKQFATALSIIFEDSTYRFVANQPFQPEDITIIKDDEYFWTNANAFYKIYKTIPFKISNAELDKQVNEYEETAFNPQTGIWSFQSTFYVTPDSTVVKPIPQSPSN